MSQSPENSKIVIGQFEFRANRRRAGHATGFRNKSTTAAHNFMKTIPIVNSCNELSIEKKYFKIAVGNIKIKNPLHAGGAVAC